MSRRTISKLFMALGLVVFVVSLLINSSPPVSDQRSYSGSAPGASSSVRNTGVWIFGGGSSNSGSQPAYHTDTSSTSSKPSSSYSNSSSSSSKPSSSYSSSTKSSSGSFSSSSSSRSSSGSFSSSRSSSRSSSGGGRKK